MNFKIPIKAKIGIVLIAVIIIAVGVKFWGWKTADWYTDIYRMSIDTDKDGLPDGWEVQYFGNLEPDPYGDFDSDGLSNGYECNPKFSFEKGKFNNCLVREDPKWTNPLNPDTNGNGINDGDEFYVRGAAKTKDVLVAGVNSTDLTSARKVFSDVLPSHKYFKSIGKAYDLNIVPEQKLSGDKFNPNQLATRAEAMTFMVRALQLETPKFVEQTTFNDVSIASWYAPYIAVAHEKGLISYIPESSNFRPEDYVTRSEFLDFVFTSLKLDKAVISDNAWSPFLDVNLKYWDAPYIIAANDLKIMTAYSDSTFRPRNSMTRGESIDVLIKALDKVSVK
ncbi:MAG: S-layer homology domain-containing protein [Patescibacteria group bacterium]|nr:S-layer homology domain-containing protein [Patescibacteria group bacterium]